MPTWIGGRPVVEYSNTITIGGTWVAGETLSVTIDGVALVLTIGTAVATTDVATALQAAWEGTSLGTGYSASPYGTESARHYELVATVSGSVVTVTERAFNSVTEGKQFPSISVSETSTSGTITLGGGNTPTGPHKWSDAANWLDGVVPVNTDTIDITGPYDIRDGLDQSAVLATATIRIPASFINSLGLPRMRDITLASGEVESFAEYRRTSLLTNSGGAITVYVGDGDGEGSPMVKIDFGGNACSVYVYETGDPTIETEPAVFLSNANSGSLYQFGGTVGIDFYPEDTASIITTAYVSTRAGIESEPELIAGHTAGSTLITSGFVKGGTATINCALAATYAWVCADGGTLNMRGAVDAAALLKAYGGLINLDSTGGTLGTLNIADGSPGVHGSVIIAGGLGALTITNCNMYSAGTSLTVEGRRSVTFTNDIIVASGLNISDVTISIPPSAQSFKVQKAALT